MTMTMLPEDVLPEDVLSEDVFSRDVLSEGGLSEGVLTDVGIQVRAELAAKTGVPESELTDDASLSDVGLDSLALIEVLMSLREQILADRGLVLDEVDDPDVLPWLETVGELIAFAATFAPWETTAPEG
jgi:aryl carrier-like protein